MTIKTSLNELFSNIFSQQMGCEEIFAGILVTNQGLHHWNLRIFFYWCTSAQGNWQHVHDLSFELSVNLTL